MNEVYFLRDIENAFSIHNNPDAVNRYTKIRGYEGSYLEHNIFELWLRISSVSTVKTLQTASSEGIPIYDIDKSNINDILPQLDIPQGAKNCITNAVYSGLTAKVSGKSITINDWTGVGYILYNPNTGVGDYRIYGGISGGGTTEEGGITKGAMVQILINLEKGAVVWIGGPAPRKIEPEEYVDKEIKEMRQEEDLISLIGKLVYHKLWSCGYNTQIADEYPKSEFYKAVYWKSSKVFFFVGHGAIKWRGVLKGWEGIGLQIDKSTVVRYDSLIPSKMPKYRFVFLLACYGADGLYSFSIRASGCKGGFTKSVYSFPGLVYTYYLFDNLSGGKDLKTSKEEAERWSGISAVFYGNLNMTLTGDDQ